MATNPNDQAFARPYSRENDGDHCFDQPGLTKREYFAAMAMQGLLANAEQWKYMGTQSLDFKNEIRGLAVEFADALIAELNKGVKE